MREAHIISFFSGITPTLHFWEGGELRNEEMAGFWSISPSGEKACIVCKIVAGHFRTPVPRWLDATEE